MRLAYGASRYGFPLALALLVISTYRPLHHAVPRGVNLRNSKYRFRITHRAKQLVGKYICEYLGHAQLTTCMEQYGQIYDRSDLLSQMP